MDSSNIFGMFKRYADISVKLPQIALKLAQYRYIDNADNTAKIASDIKDILGDLKGPVMKIAQLLSTVPDLIPAEFAAELGKLQSLAPPMHYLFVKRRMRAELGENWEDYFQTFEKQASAAASLGQVHKAVTNEGLSVACKLQYPDMRSAVSADLSQLKMMFGLLDQYMGGVQSDKIFTEIQARLLEELDYTIEAKRMKIFARIHQNNEYVNVPDVIDHLSTERLLTMSWLQGDNLKSCLEKPLADRNTIACNLFHTWYVPFYHHHIIHGDPHFGNYGINQDLQINLLDFGCVREFTAEFVHGVIDLYHSFLHNDKALAVHAYEKLGFENISAELLQVLNYWAEFLYRPLTEDRVRPIDYTGSGTPGIDVAKKVYHELRKLGGVQPPRAFVFLDRATVGLGSAFLHLRAEVNWHREFQTILSTVPYVQA